jgi:hypothetical protein
VAFPFFGFDDVPRFAVCGFSAECFVKIVFHCEYLSFFTLILYHIEAGLSILLGKIIFKKILQKTLDKLCRMWYNTKFGAQRPRAAQAKEKEGFLPSFLVTVLGL